MRVACQKEDIEARIEHDVFRKWQEAQCGLRARDECGRRIWKIRVRIHWGGSLSYAKETGFYPIGEPLLVPE